MFCLFVCKIFDSTDIVRESFHSQQQQQQRQQQQLGKYIAKGILNNMDQVCGLAAASLTMKNM